MTTKHNSRLVATIAERFGGNDNFKLQTDVRDKISLYESHVMISDWSGVAMEYAFACERPVVFIDVPKKCNNPETDRIPQVPVEVSLRGKVGRVISPNQLDAVVAAIESICADTDQFTAHIREVRDSYVFNLGRSVDVAARDIVEIADELQIANDG
jgi:YidC/Oxa1 family membrane protein insertase